MPSIQNLITVQAISTYKNPSHGMHHLMCYMFLLLLALHLDAHELKNKRLAIVLTFPITLAHFCSWKCSLRNFYFYYHPCTAGLSPSRIEEAGNPSKYPLVFMPVTDGRLPARRYDFKNK